MTLKKSLLLTISRTLLPEFLEFSVEWFAFRTFNYSFRSFWKLFREILNQICICFQIFETFG